MKCCYSCPNKGCGAYHDKCEKYQEQVKANRIAHEERYMDNIKDSMAYPLVPGKPRRKRRMNETYW